ncbi:cysteine proteinase [Obba rivulosa]|uniref:Cysteine proteinase n=1 Tax=Obba rivulosa TaxID=1052685 RepID=A0A8E2DVU2_9APHY|nr:cysteine proteinase [Obba rivulosa]
MQKRKRDDNDTLLPLRASKQPRNSLKHCFGGNSSPSQFEGVSARFAFLVQEGWRFLSAAFTHLVQGTSPAPLVIIPEAPAASTSSALLPSPPPSPPMAARAQELPNQRRPPPRTRRKSTPPEQIPLPPSPNPLPRSQPPPRREPRQSHAPVGLPSPPSTSALSASTSLSGSHAQFDALLAQASLAHGDQRPRRTYVNREHIHAKPHRVRIAEERRKDREVMEKELYELRRSFGYSSDLDSFRSLLSYRERLERLEVRDVLSPSRSLTDLRAQRAAPSHQRRHSDDASPEFLRRALEKAKASLREPRPKIVDIAQVLQNLELERKAKDKEIERRLRARKALPATLPPEDEATVNALFAKRGVVGRCEREQVTDRDLSRLRPRQWLNDEIINFYGQMILLRAEASKENPGNGKARERGKPLNAHYFSTFFWTKLKGEGYEKGRLAKWTKKIDLFAKDVVLIPVNHNNAHWTAAAINFRRKRIESYDSMGMERDQVFKQLRSYLDAEHRNKKKKPFDFTGWEDYTLPDTPQQENGYDCGVFTCQFLEALSRGEESFVFTQANMPYLRRRMVWEIGHGKLRDDT